MSEISAVVFDIGNVFVRWDPRNLYRNHFSNPAEMEHFLETVTTAKWNLAQDAGRSFADAVALLTAEFPHYAEEISLFDTKWVNTLDEEISGTVEILERLVADQIPVFAITNFSAEKWPVFCARHSFTRHFQDIVVSGEERLVKPDRRIYELALRRFGIAPEGSIFIDDSIENVRGAEAVGMAAHHFKDANLLADDLRKRGILR